MIANAGIVPFAPILEGKSCHSCAKHAFHCIIRGSVQDFDRCFAVNVRGTMLLYKYAALQMLKQGRGGRLIGSSTMCLTFFVLNRFSTAASSAAGKEGGDISYFPAENYLHHLLSSPFPIRILSFQVCYPWVDSSSWYARVPIQYDITELNIFSHWTMSIQHYSELLRSWPDLHWDR